MVHILLKLGLKNFEHYFASVSDDYNCVAVWAFFVIAFLWDWNENWPFPVLWPLLSFPNLPQVGGHLTPLSLGSRVSWCFQVRAPGSSGAISWPLLVSRSSGVAPFKRLLNASHSLRDWGKCWDTFGLWQAWAPLAPRKGCQAWSWSWGGTLCCVFFFFGSTIQDFCSQTGDFWNIIN